MRRILIISTTVVAVLWVAAAAIRLLLPSGAHLAEQADTILYWVAVVATTVLATMGLYVLLHHQPLLMRIAGWTFYFLFVLEGIFVAAIIGAALFDAADLAKPYHIDDRYLVREDFLDGSVLYERQGMVERRLSAIQYGWYLDDKHVDNLRVAICPKHELLLIECDDPLGPNPSEDAIAIQSHHRYLQSLEGHRYTDAETLDLLERCPELMQ